MRSTKRREPVTDNVAQIWRNFVVLIRDFFALFSLEMKLATKSLFIVVLLGILALLFLLTAWISLFAAIVIGLLSHYIGWITALIIVACINLLLAMGIGIAIVIYSRKIGLPETQQTLQHWVENEDE